MSAQGTDTAAIGRKYRILKVIGKGGFGQVYRARLEGPNNFYKDVAIKLLKAEVADEEMLQRFRDEARILGLVRDRAIVGVDPPTRIAGRWAVVMEFVDGAAASRLLKAGPLPPSVALEIVEEVARALHKLYKHPGLDGQPLNILHRDLKPANLQITPSGEVKLLDFGMSKADFSEREAATKTNLGGTPGYIAPERLDGEETPAGDVYSLGIVLYRLVTKELPAKQRKPGEGRPEALDTATDPVERVVHLADWMRSFLPADRPSMKDVQDVARKLRAEIGGESLRDWAERMVPAASEMAEDELCGSLVSEMSRTEDVRLTGEIPAAFAPAVAPPPVPAGPPAWVPYAAGGLVLVIAASIVGIVGIVASGALSPPPAPVAAVVEPAPPPVEPPPPPVEPPPPVVAEAPIEAPVPTEPPPVEPPKPEVKAKAVVKKVEAAPPPPPAEPVPAVKSYEVTLGSVPLGAEVYVDGAKKGNTPLAKLALGEGNHEVKMVFGDKEIVREVRVGKRAATRFLWRVDTGDWETGY